MAVGSSAETVSMRGSASLAEQQQQEAPSAAAAARPVCVECGRPVALLFREYNKGNIRLGRCVSLYDSLKIELPVLRPRNMGTQEQTATGETTLVGPHAAQ